MISEPIVLFCLNGNMYQASGAFNDFGVLPFLLHCSFLILNSVCRYRK